MEDDEFRSECWGVLVIVILRLEDDGFLMGCLEVDEMIWLFDA